MTALAVFLVFLSALFPHNAPQIPQSYSIAGVVVDAITGAPIPHAELSISSKDEELHVTTGSDGRFRFARLEPGKYQLHAEAQLYVREDFDQHGAFSTAIVVGAGLDSEHLVFRLHSQAVIHGRVTDDHGDPVRHAFAQLFGFSKYQGVRSNVMQTQTQTNDLGEYRFSHLLAGRYCVAVQAQPWYARIGLAKRNNLDQIGIVGFSGRIDLPLDPLLDVVYPLTFYPGVIDARSASEQGRPTSTWEH